MAKEKKGQKFGRHSRAASNSQQRYRTERNKRLNKERQAAAKKDKREHPPKVPRGTARAKRRAHLQQHREAA